MSPMDYMLVPLRKYADFTGRARRMEYWMFVVLNIGVSIVTSIVDKILGMGASVFNVYGPLQMVAMLALFIPGLAVGARRLHDQDKSGWFLLLALIPILGAIALLVLFLLPGTAGENKYGPDPKAGMAS